MPSIVDLFHVSELADAEYAYAASAPASARMIFLAGACPLDADGAVVAGGDVGGQTRKSIDNLIAALGAADAGLYDVISTRILVASSDRHDLVEAWRVVRDAFGDHEPPSTLMGVTVLGYPGQLVEVEAVAAVAP